MEWLRNPKNAAIIVVLAVVIVAGAIGLIYKQTRPDPRTTATYVFKSAPDPNE